MNTKTKRVDNRNRRPLWWGALLALVLVEVAVFAWLRPDHSQWDSTERLQISVAEKEETISLGETHYQFLNQPERLSDIRSQLSFSDGICGLFAPAGQPIRSETATVELFYFEYSAGNPLFIEDVLGHAPEVCMKASGAVLRQVHPVRNLDVDGQSLAVRVLEFETPLGTAPLWVFRVTWLPAGSPFESASDAATLRKERILGGLLGNPRPPARVILAGARNFRSEESAWNAFDALIGEQLFLQVPNEFASLEP